MAFEANLEIVDGVAQITLIGELDRGSAPIFQGKVEEAAAQSPSRLVLFAKDLEYMASAGLRVLLFSKQKMGSEVDIYFVAPQDDISETLEKTQFDQVVIIVDKYEG